MNEETLKFKEYKIIALILDKMPYLIGNADAEMIGLLTSLLGLLYREARK